MATSLETAIPVQPATHSVKIAAKNEIAGDLMSPPVGVFGPHMTVAETVEQLRELTRAAFITYCYVTDPAGKLLGLVVMRDRRLAKPEARLEEIML